MEFILNLSEIREGIEYLPISGVTSNPSIVKSEGPKDFFEHMREIRRIIGKDRSLHVQVITKEADLIVKEAERILKEIDEEVFIKVPVTLEGVKAIKILKEKNINITATGVYTIMQAYLALEAGADYIAPYVNRIGNLEGNAMKLIKDLAARIENDKYDCKILAASFKNIEQIKDVLENESHSVTVPFSLLKQVFLNPSIDKAVDDFTKDWESIYGDNKSILDLQ